MTNHCNIDFKIKGSKKQLKEFINLELAKGKEEWDSSYLISYKEMIPNEYSLNLESQEINLSVFFYNDKTIVSIEEADCIKICVESVCEYMILIEKLGRISAKYSTLDFTVIFCEQEKSDKDQSIRLIVGKAQINQGIILIKNFNKTDDEYWDICFKVNADPIDYISSMKIETLEEIKEEFTDTIIGKYNLRQYIKDNN